MDQCECEMDLILPVLFVCGAYCVLLMGNQGKGLGVSSLPLSKMVASLKMGDNRSTLFFTNNSIFLSANLNI